MPGTPSASIVIPTRGRPGYLAATLATVVPQASVQGAEVLVVQDGLDAGTEAVARRHAVRLLTLDPPAGANAARNAGLHAAQADLVVFTDDDVEAPEGWLEALVSAARDHEVLGGPIRPRLEGGGPRACGREPAPITALDLGSVDREAELVWSANMAVRRSAFARVGEFDESIHGRGEEEEWERRYRAAGGRIRYVAGAGLVHRRSPDDSRLRSLARAAYRLGRSARRNDLRKGVAPSVGLELRVLAGCLWHTLRRRCAYGIVMAAHTLGRLRELTAERRR